MYPLCASLIPLGAHQPERLRHTFCTFGLIQKLSKPVPISGLPAAPSTAAHISVRPLRPSPLPSALETSDPPPKSMDRPPARTIAKHSAYTRPGLFLIARRVVRSIS